MGLYTVPNVYYIAQSTAQTCWRAGYEMLLRYKGKDPSLLSMKLNSSVRYLAVILPLFLATSVLAQNKNYTSLNNLVVVYYNTNGGTLPSDLVSSGDLKYVLDKASLYYWRHSHTSLSLKWTVLEVATYVNFPELVDNYLYPENIDADLNSRGIGDGSYDAVYAIASNSGNFAWSVTSCLGNAGFCQTGWWGKEYGVWAIIHEYHHVLDSFFEDAGYPEYPLNHPGAARARGENVPNSGGGYDLNAEILRYWPVEKWLALPVNGAWGKVLSTTDNDGDGVPDSDASLPLDEKRLGSKPTAKDSDDDGLDDLGEAMAGMFSSANPNAADTDGDGTEDQNDQYPLYPCKTAAPFGTCNLSNFDSWPLLGHYYFEHPEASVNTDLRMGWDGNYLYVGVKVPETAAGNMTLHLDCNGDGLFHGPDNLEIVLSGNTITSVLLRDAENADPGSDFAESQLSSSGYIGKTEPGSNWTTYKIAVPRDKTHGLSLTVGEQVGIRVLVDYYGEMFETDRYFNVQLDWWANSQNLGSGWRWLDWFGYFNVDASPWIYHEHHGWLYPFGETTADIVFWDASMSAFWWTSETVYPFCYRFSDSAWLWYQEKTINPRWFYNYKTSKWESD